jgi:hypothetical protein
VPETRVFFRGSLSSNMIHNCDDRRGQDAPGDSLAMRLPHMTPSVYRARTSKELAHADLPARDVIELLSDKWRVPVLHLLRTGPQRANQLQRALNRVSPKMLTQTLRGLERDGLVHRQILLIRSFGFWQPSGYQEAGLTSCDIVGSSKHLVGNAVYSSNRRSETDVGW